MSTQDDVLICDPEGEYDPIIKEFKGQIINIAAGSKDHINAMDMRMAMETVEILSVTNLSSLCLYLNN